MLDIMRNPGGATAVGGTVQAVQAMVQRPSQLRTDHHCLRLYTSVQKRAGGSGGDLPQMLELV